MAEINAIEAFNNLELYWNGKANGWTVKVHDATGKGGKVAGTLPTDTVIYLKDVWIKGHDRPTRASKPGSKKYHISIHGMLVEEIPVSEDQFLEYDAYGFAEDVDTGHYVIHSVAYVKLGVSKAVLGGVTFALPLISLIEDKEPRKKIEIAPTKKQVVLTKAKPAPSPFMSDEITDGIIAALKRTQAAQSLEVVEEVAVTHSVEHVEIVDEIADNFAEAIEAVIEASLPTDDDFENFINQNRDQFSEETEESPTEEFDQSVPNQTFDEV